MSGRFDKNESLCGRNEVSDALRYQNRDGTYTSAGKKRKQKDYVHEDYANAHSKKSVKSMSNAELKARNNRLQMEQQYANLTRKTTTGKKAVQTFIKGAGLLSGAMAAYGTYKKYGDQAINVLGDFVLSDLQKGLAKGW